MRLPREAAKQVGATYASRGSYTVLTEATKLNLGYWKKNEDPDFHSGKLGGKRTSKYSSFDEVRIEKALWDLVKINPARTIQQFADELNSFLGLEEPILWNYVQRLFKKWGWSWKVSQNLMINKFSKKNIENWRAFAEFVLRTPKAKLKFLDESHFSSRETRKRKAVGPPGVPILVVDGKFIDVRYSVTLLTSVAHGDLPFWFDMRKSSNTAADFINFVSTAIKADYLVDGDFLIVDNAAVHSAAYIDKELTELLQENGITLVKLPTYSPELNPCELVFGFVKNHIKYKVQKGKFSDDIVEGLSQITERTLRNYYRKCKWIFTEEKALVEPRKRVIF